MSIPGRRVHQSVLNKWLPTCVGLDTAVTDEFDAWRTLIEELIIIPNVI